MQFVNSKRRDDLLRQQDKKHIKEGIRNPMHAAAPQRADFHRLKYNQAWRHLVMCF